MEKLIRIGIDTSKQFFQLHGVNAAEQPVLRKKLRRKELLGFLAKLEPTVIGLEACGGSHYWAREIRALGHEAKLMPTQYVQAYVKRGKNDGIDAAAACEGVGRPLMRFVPVKTADNQAALMLAGMRERVIRTQTQLSNRIRGYAAEFGVIAPKGKSKLPLLFERIQEEPNIPALAREMFALLADEYAELSARVEAVDRRLMAWHRQDECSRRLAKLDGVGPVGASLLVMKVPHPELFRSARDFAAWIGLTPKDHSTANKQRLGGITRAGDEQLRAVLVSGAMAVLRHAKRRGCHRSSVLTSLLQRKPTKVAAVALANKNARVAWRLMVSGSTYDPLRPGPTDLAPCSVPSRTLARRFAVAAQSLTAPARGARH